MRKVAFKNIWAHKFRMLSLFAIIAAGTGFIAGALVLGATMTRTFNNLFASVYENTDAVVRAKAPFDTDNSTHPPVPASLLDAVKQVKDVEAADANVSITAQAVGADGKVVGLTGAPNFGFNWSAETWNNPYRLREGKPPVSDDEIVIDRGVAKKAKAKVGDQLTVLTAAGSATYTVSGIATFGDLDNAGGTTAVMFTLPKIQALAEAAGRPADTYDNISVAARAGVSQTTLKDELTQAVASNNSYEVLTGKEATKENEDALKSFLSFFTIVLLVFAGVAVVVGMFVIYNTFGILIAQRTRETALLRAIGASAAQVLRSVIVESIVVGLIGSLVGLVFGLGLAALLKLAFSAFGVDLPAGGLAVPLSAVIAPLVVGTITTLLSAAIPAYRAGRVPPLAALQDVAIDRSARSTRRAVLGGIFLAGGVLMLVAGLAGGSVYLIGGSFLVVILGVAIVGPVVARPFTRFIGAPLPATRGMTGTLARENASRNPKRTSSTAMALTVGVAIVVFIIVMATSIKASVAGAVDKQFAADYVVQSKGFGSGFSPQLNEQFKQLPQVEATSALRFNQAQIDGKVRSVIAVQPDTITAVFNFGRVSGDFGALSDDAIAVSEKVAKNHGWSLGSTIHTGFINGARDLKVTAIYERDTVMGGYIIGLPTYESGYNEQFDAVLMIKTRPGADQAAFRTAADGLLKGYPSAELQNQKEFKDSQAAQINGLVVFVYVLLALAIIVALIGIGTTLALSVHERTRELGLLRAVGQGRGQTRGTVRWESAIVAVFGTVLGLVVGVAFGIAIVHALADEGLDTVRIPVAFLVGVVVAAGVAGVIASLWPAHRAAKLDVLQAIATE